MSDVIKREEVGEIQTIPESMPASPWAGVIQKIDINNTDIATIERFITLQREEEDRQAERAFNASMSRLQGLIPEISKTGKAKFPTSKGVIEYNFDNLNDICNALRPFLIETGLSFSFKQAQEKGAITVKCTVSHSLGHSESNQMTSAPDSSGTKNAIQAIASTNTYLQRYTLKSAFGISSVDDDGSASTGIKQAKDDQIEFARWMATAIPTMDMQADLIALDKWYQKAISYSGKYNKSFVVELQEKYTEIKKVKGW